MTTMDNPYWDAVKDAVKASDFTWEGPCIGQWSLDEAAPLLNRREHVHKYAWAVTNPASVTFVAEHARTGVVDTHGKHDLEFKVVDA